MLSSVKLSRLCGSVLIFTSLQEFDEPRDADDAVYDLNGKELAGERVMLEFSKRGPRAGGGGRGFDRYPPPRRDARLACIL